jgi:hypothetical protein
MPSKRNIVRQPSSPKRPWPVLMIHDDSGAPMAEEMGIASMNRATIRVRSLCGNQNLR